MKTITFDETKWKLVPIEPTKEMEKSAFLNVEINHFPGFNSGTEARNSIYYAMISAAPDYEPEADEDGWIKWEVPGVSRCPLDANTKIDVRFRDGSANSYDGYWDAKDYDWNSYNSKSDIVAYRIVK